MGCGASKPAAAATASPRTTSSTVTSTVNGKSMTNANPETKPEVAKQPKIYTEPIGLGPKSKGLHLDWKVRPGYSSGASSYAGSDCDDRSDELSIGASQRGRKRGEKDRESALSSLRQEMNAGGGGDLTKNIVRIETDFGKPIEEIYDGVQGGPVLGSGVSGTVRLVTHRATGVNYAVKCLDLGLIDTTEGLKQLRDEIFIMCQLDHPNIVRIEEVYESPNEIFIVQELCHGGDLFDRLDEQPDFHYTEAQCARLVKQMLSSVRYLHSKGIIHRDLKLENFLFSSQQPDSELKMIDFGLSKHFELGQTHEEKVGTPYTVAPEIIRGSYDEKSDIWALGVITYLLLSGETPFGGLDGENLLLVKETILRAEVLFEPADVWEHVSPTGRAFVKRTLMPESPLRPTAKELQKDEWIQVWAKKEVAAGNKLNKKTLDSLLEFKESSDMRKLLSEVLSFTLLPEQIVDLRKEFEKIDTDGDGEITLTAMKHVLMENAEAGSLGALTEQEIEDIFDAIRIRKSEPTIRWHEFLAAGLSQARVDDRNLRLAFDRMDTDRKGFITLSDLNDLLGSSAESDSLERCWIESLKECKARGSRISYADFKSLMKGQSNTDKQKVSGMSVSAMLQSQGSLGAVPEMRPGGELANFETNMAGMGLTFERDGPSHEPPIPGRKEMHKKTRSRSFDHQSEMWVPESPGVNRGGRKLAILLRPEDSSSEFEMPHNNNSSTMSAHLVNRTLYRKHREMRLAVLDASKQFDKKRIARKEDPVPKQASLIMKRGQVAPVDLEDKHTRALFEAAAKRCGRSRRTRDKTVSDVTGMLLMPV